MVAKLPLNDELLADDEVVDVIMHSLQKQAAFNIAI